MGLECSSCGRRLGSFSVYDIGIDPGILSELLSEVAKFLEQSLSLKLCIILHVFWLSERELDFNKLGDVIFVDSFGSHKLDSGDPVVPVHIFLCSKSELVGGLYKGPLLDVLTDKDVKIEGLRLHDRFLTSINMLNLDPSQWVHTLLVLLVIMVPLKIFSGEDEQTL